MIPFLPALCILGALLVGLLLVTGLIEPEQAGAAIIRGLLAIVFLWLTICLVKGLIARVLAALTVALHWILIVALVIAVIAVVVVLVMRFIRHLPRNVEGDEL